PPRPPPLPILFPYTTLLRSTPTPTITPILADFQPPRILQACFDTKPLVSEPLFRAAVNRVADVLDSSVNINEGAIQVYISYITSDRKSTRLNSSHQIISYAV